MLSADEVIRIQQVLLKDIKRQRLSSDDVTELIYIYLENIAGLECLDDESLSKIVLTIKKGLGC